MAVNASRDGNGIFLSIRWDSHWPSWSLLPTLPDRDGARQLLRRGCGFGQKLRLIWVDGAYRGSLQRWVAQRFRFRLQPVLRPQEQKGFSVLPRRWVVERTFAWLGLNRRLCKDYERLPESSVAFIHIAMIRLMVRRLAPN